MAIGGGGKDLLGEDIDVEAEAEACYLSDESDFYGTLSNSSFFPSTLSSTRLTIQSGDEAVKQDFEDRAGAFSVAAWWKHRISSLTDIANFNTARDVDKQTAVLYNPYEGVFCGRQLNEEVEEFLERLPPATTPVSGLIPWIFIANPYRKAPKVLKVEKGQEDLNYEGPPDADSDWARFVVLGGSLLNELTNTRHDIEKKMAGATKSAVTKTVNVQKDMIVKKLLDTAVDCHCTSGKVLLGSPSVYFG
jgi:hypothetical protein